MKSILVLGGYGSFGARICELLARDPRFKVIAAGRSLVKAEAFCRSRPDLKLTPASVDRARGFCASLAELGPWLVIDAAGPFQGAAYDVARSCLEAHCHYMDIADGRAFVEGFDSLDSEARAAGLTLISGASSTPALSSAVVDELVVGLDTVGLVESAISASNRATVGQSVMEAILSYVGRPVTVQQAGRTHEARGWRDLRNLTFAVSGSPPLRRRWVAICDVPDLGLLSDRLPGHPLVIFRAGVELAFQNFMLWLLSWPVEWGWITDLRLWAGAFRRLRVLSAWIGGDRSAMQVRVVGLRGRSVVERRWTLLADRGQGPYTPCLAAALLAKRLADGGLPAGATAAVGLLSLQAFARDFDILGLRTEIVEAKVSSPLYHRVMGADFDHLPPQVRDMHEFAGAGLAEGRATITRGANPLAQLIAKMMGFPPAGSDVPVTVRFLERDGHETWLRNFGGAEFSSQLSQGGGLLIERFGPLRFGFELTGDGPGLGMHLRRWWLGPVPLPLALGPSGIARETEVDGAFHFDVPIALPLVGSIVSYRGWLQRV